MNRSSGILLHISSLPSRFGIGGLGGSARQFIDFLADAGQGLWQVLPLGPTGYGDSPYQALSAFAGNPNFISPEVLLHDGWLDEQDLDVPGFPDTHVDYGAVIPWKKHLLATAFGRFRQQANDAQRADFEGFCHQHGAWLEDFALFAALKEHFQSAWTAWEPGLVQRHPGALEYWRGELGDQIELQKFVQHQFFHQWAKLREYAHSRGVRLIGDVPLFVAHDSADVWAHPEWFYLGDNGYPTVVAGVPPDYFSATGQLWGNPLYNWERLAENGYAFWVERLRLLLSLVDTVRLDHFRGLAAYWEVPSDHDTALHGRWVPGPGKALFDKLEAALGGLPLIAEDLGIITPDVDALRKELGLPGMAVLQFAFAIDAKGYVDSPYLPHNHTRDLAVYTGTHDNNTTLGWWQTISDMDRHYIRRYFNTDAMALHWDFIRAALASVADTAILPLQDVLGLGSEACLNRPGHAENNWTWRYQTETLTPDLATWLRELSGLYGRKRG
jgi:4-alpha-glucanotransferase